MGSIEPVGIILRDYKGDETIHYLSELDDTTLSIFQGFSGVQSGEVLEVDLETESVFWANAMVTDGTLNLVFAETATPNDTILEVA